MQNLIIQMKSNPNTHLSLIVLPYYLLFHSYQFYLAWLLFSFNSLLCLVIYLDSVCRRLPNTWLQSSWEHSLFIFLLLVIRYICQSWFYKLVNNITLFLKLSLNFLQFHLQNLSLFMLIFYLSMHINSKFPLFV